MGTQYAVGRGIPAAPAREHVLQLIADQKVTATWVARQAGLSTRTVSQVLTGRRQAIYATTANALLTVGRDLLDTPARQLPRAHPRVAYAKVCEMVDNGWTVDDIASIGRVSAAEVTACEHGEPVTARAECAIDRAWRALAGRTGGAPRPYMWLAELVAAYAPAEITSGAGVAPNVVQRLRDGLPLERGEARAVGVWMVLDRHARQSGVVQPAA